MERIVHASVWVYRQLLLVYPRELRARFAVDMAEVFEDSLQDASAQEGTAGIAVLWRSAFVELATIAIPARMKSNVIIASGLSFLLSSLITWVFLRAVG
jgi:hypothetical protein